MLTFTIYEYQGLGLLTPHFTLAHLTAIQKAHDPEDGFYDLGYKQVRFKGMVGLLHFGDFQVEVLPKADRLEKGDVNHWRQFLFKMMRQAGWFELDKVPDAAAQHSKTMLDLLLGRYLALLETHLQRGLIKRYRQHQGQVKALRGRLLMAEHIQQNLVHAERFYTAHTRYDFDHALNQVFAAALAVVPRLSIGSAIQAQAMRLSIAFPEVADLQPAHALSMSARIREDRKSAPFKEALKLAKLILLHYHPDTRSGNPLVFSLMLSMDKLWEAWLRARLRRAGAEIAKIQKTFYSTTGRTIRAIPDIVILKKGRPVAILDAKWKLPTDGRPSEHDLRQVFTYLHLFGHTRGALVYPGAFWCEPEWGHYTQSHHHGEKLECDLLYVPVDGDGWEEKLLAHFAVSELQPS